MLYFSIFPKLIFCQKKFSSAVNFRKVKSIYKSKHKRGVTETRRVCGAAGSPSAEVTVGAALAGGVQACPVLPQHCAERGLCVQKTEAQRAVSPLQCNSSLPPISRRQWTVCVCVFAARCWALGRIDERLGTGKGQILKSLRVGEIAG